MALPAVGTAHDTRFPTNITWGFDPTNGIMPDAFVGYLNLSSGNRDCRPGRLVKVYRVRPGNDPLIGSDRTDTGGYFVIERNVPAGRYYAKVGAKDLGEGVHDHLCGGRRTSNLAID